MSKTSVISGCVWSAACAFLLCGGIPLRAEQQGDFADRTRQPLTQAERDARKQERRSRLERTVALVAETVGARPGPRAVVPPGSYALSIDTDLELGGNIFKDGYPFLHDDYPGARNVALGRAAMVSLTTYVPYPYSGTNNTAVGSYALRDTTSGRNNAAVGAYALQSNTTGDNNSAQGAFALSSNTDGYSNTAVGTSALFSNGQGYDNTAVGAFALLSAATSLENTAVGSEALMASDGGDENTAVGAFALTSNTTGNDNTAIGKSALAANTTAGSNTAIGRQALLSATGGDNVAVGANAGINITDGTHNILIGSAGNSADSGVIRLGVQSVQSAAYVAGVIGAASNGGIPVFVNGSGKLGTATSSRRFKEEIEPIEGSDSRLQELQPVSFRYTEETIGTGPRLREYGLIAEEVAEVFPDLVVYDDAGKPFTVRYHLLTPILLNELQQQHRHVRRLNWAVGLMFMTGVIVMTGRWWSAR